jgi:hypothetical protein
MYMSTSYWPGTPLDYFITDLRTKYSTIKPIVNPKTKSKMHI